jgi:hypothetical protein
MTSEITEAQRTKKSQYLLITMMITNKIQNLTFKGPKFISNFIKIRPANFMKIRPSAFELKREDRRRDTVSPVYIHVTQNVQRTQ